MYKNPVPDNVRRKKLEALGLLAGGIVHDFSNLLTGINGYIELARTEVPENSNVYTYLEEAGTICDLAGEMVKEIFRSFMDSGEEAVNLHIVPVIKECLNLFKTSLPAYITLVEYIDVSSDTVLIDKIKIYHILNNLCINAAQAIGDREGIIEVSLSDIKDEDIKLHPDLKERHYLSLTVKDNGCGIKNEVLPHIFEFFFTTKKYKKGKGIGLALVHNIINDLGGKIYVRSKEGEYSIFQVFLPVASTTGKIIPSHMERENETELSGTRKSILCIDDDLAIGITQQKFLEKKGYDTTVAKNFTEGLNIFCSDPHKYDLIITDYSIGHKTGIELAEEIFRIRSDLPVILCTGDYNSAMKEKAMKAGIKDIIVKPYGYGIFIATIDKFLNGSE